MSCIECTKYFRYSKFYSVTALQCYVNWIFHRHCSRKL